MTDLMTGTIDCARKCEIPAEVRLADVPEPRHDWGDVFGCPNEDCGRWFLVMRDDASTEPADLEQP